MTTGGLEKTLMAYFVTDWTFIGLQKWVDLLVFGKGNVYW
jgi:hypothetical protein